MWRKTLNFNAVNVFCCTTFRSSIVQRGITFYCKQIKLNSGAKPLGKLCMCVCVCGGGGGGGGEGEGG